MMKQHQCVALALLGTVAGFAKVPYSSLLGRGFGLSGDMVTVSWHVPNPLAVKSNCDENHHDQKFWQSGTCNSLDKFITAAHPSLFDDAASHAIKVTCSGGVAEVMYYKTATCDGLPFAEETGSTASSPLCVPFGYVKESGTAGDPDTPWTASDDKSTPGTAGDRDTPWTASDGKGTPGTAGDPGTDGPGTDTPVGPGAIEAYILGAFSFVCPPELPVTDTPVGKGTGGKVTGGKVTGGTRVTLANLLANRVKKSEKVGGQRVTGGWVRVGSASG
jgi:hypothetical protein